MTKRIIDSVTADQINKYELKLPQSSDWQCHLFGSTGSNGLTWTPREGCEPNWFWRKMQYLIFGNKWVNTANLDSD